MPTIGQYDVPAESNAYDTFVDTYVPIPFDEMMKVGMMKQQQQEQTYDALSKTYEDVYNLKYIPNSKDEQYVKSVVIPTAKEIFDKYSTSDLSPITLRQIRRDFNTKIDKNLVKDIQDSYLGWKQHEVQKQKLASEDRLDPYEEDRSSGYNTAVHGVYNNFSVAYSDPIADLQKKFFVPLKESLLRDSKGNLRTTSRGFNVEGVTPEIIQNVVEKNLDTEVATREGRRAISLYRDRYGLTKDQASDKEVLRKAFTEAGEPFIRENLTGSQYPEWMFRDKGEKEKSIPLQPVSMSPQFNLAGIKEGDVPSIEDITGVKQKGFFGKVLAAAKEGFTMGFGTHEEKQSFKTQHEDALDKLFSGNYIRPEDKTPQYKQVEQQAKNFFNYKGKDENQLSDLTKKYIEHFYTKGHSTPVFEIPTDEAAKQSNDLMFNKNNIATNREFYDTDKPLTPTNRMQYSELVDEYPQSKYLYNIVGAIGANNPMFPSGRQVNIYKKDKNDQPTELVKTFFMGPGEGEKDLGRFPHNFHQINYNVQGNRKYNDTFWDGKLGKTVPMEISQERIDFPQGDEFKVDIKFKVDGKSYTFPPKDTSEDRKYFPDTESALATFTNYYRSITRSK
jgi:hypothetical protein